MIDVYKELFKYIRRIEIISKKLATELTMGPYHSAFKGRGMEFEEVREYVEGDDIRSIDWNVTARMNHIYVKNYREERELPVILLVDISGSMQFGSENQQKNTLIAEIASLLAFTAIKNLDNIGLLLFSNIVEKYIPPRKGLKHSLRLIRDILFQKPQNQLSDLTPALNYLGKVQKKRCICFLLSDFMFSLPFQKLAQISKIHDLIPIYVYDKYDSLPNLGLIYTKNLETGDFKYIDTNHPKVRKILMEEQHYRKENFKEMMRKIGCDYLFLETNQPYEKEIRKFFNHRKTRR